MRALRLVVCASSTVMDDARQGERVATLCANAERFSLEDERLYTNHRLLYRNHARQYSNHERLYRNHQPLSVRASSTDVHDGSLSLEDERRCLPDAQLHFIAAPHSSNGERLRERVQPLRRSSAASASPSTARRTWPMAKKLDHEREVVGESMLSMTFPPPKQGGFVTVEYPIQLSPDEPDGGDAP
jgi:hypothetical protein